MWLKIPSLWNINVAGTCITRHKLLHNVEKTGSPQSEIYIYIKTQEPKALACARFIN